MELDEASYFLRLYLSDFSAAIDTLKVLKRYRRPDVQYALLRDLVVAYVRPFSVNKGRRGKNVLDAEKYVPKSMRALHNELKRVRNQQFAHTDLSFYSPERLTFKGPTGDIHFYATMTVGYDYAALLRRLSDIKALISTVERTLHAEIMRQDGPVVPVPLGMEGFLEILKQKSE